MARRLLHLALLPSLLVALAGCGGAENERMLPPEDAEALIAHLDAAEDAAEEDRCGRARSQLRQAAARNDQLDDEVSERLRRNIADWIAYIRAELPEVCEPEPEETPTPEPTPTPPPATPTPAPTPEPTPEPTPSPTPTPTPDDDDDDDDDNDDNETGGSGGSGNSGGTGGSSAPGGGSG